MRDLRVAYAFGKGLALFPFDHYTGLVFMTEAILEGGRPSLYKRYFGPLDVSVRETNALRSMADRLHGMWGVPAGFDTKKVAAIIERHTGHTVTVKKLNDRDLKDQYAYSARKAYERMEQMVGEREDGEMCEMLLPVASTAANAIRSPTGRRLSRAYCPLVSRRDYAVGERSKILRELSQVVNETVRRAHPHMAMHGPFTFLR